MAKDIRELSRELKQLINDLPSINSDLAISTALNVKALSERTIREQGFGASYVDGSYKRRRAEIGLETDWVTLAFTNVMWSGMIPTQVQREGSKYYSGLTHTNEEGLNKMKWNFDRYGNFIDKAMTLNDNEAKIHEMIGFELNRIFNTYIT